MIEHGFQESGAGERISGNFIEVAGIKSYERMGSLVVGDKHVSTIGHLILGDGRFYSLQAMRFDGDAGGDPEIRQMLDSFRFIRPPVQSDAPKSISCHIGQLTGVLMLVLAIAALVVFAIRRTQPRRSVPPPLPPSGH